MTPAAHEFAQPVIDRSNIDRSMLKIIDGVEIEKWIGPNPLSGACCLRKCQRRLRNGLSQTQCAAKG